MVEKLNPVTVINETGSSDWLLICEHASKHIPKSLHNLGLSEAELDTHISYDIGAYEMTVALSKKLDATAILCNYSRLVIDCNRTLIAPDCIPSISDGIVIPGNQALSLKQRLQRIQHIYRPFHQCVSDVVAIKAASNNQIKIANIHSFTPMLSEEGLQRPWDIGFIYRQPEPSQTIIRNIRQNTDYTVGDNEPYNGFIHRGYTIPAHADAQEIPSFLVEFRQNLIGSTEPIDHWSNILTQAIKSI